MEHLWDAAVKGDCDAVTHVLSNLGVNVTLADDNGRTALHWAAWSDESSQHFIVEQLISDGADVNTCDNNGRPPLHYFVERKDVNINAIAALLHHRGSVNLVSTDAKRETALHIACRTQRQDIAQLLLAFGASVHIRNGDERRPAELGLTDFINQAPLQF